jgi:hypothetical protein
MLRTAVFSACVLALLAVSLARYSPIADDLFHGRVPAAEVAAIRTPASSRSTPEIGRYSSYPEVALEPESLTEEDTTHLLQPPLTIDHLLDELNSDLGAGAVPVDRDAVEALLRRDPELRKALVK